MADNTVSQVMPFVNETGLKFIENNGQILFSTEEIGKQLGYSKPAKSVNILWNRNQKELAGYAVGIKLMSTDGKYYQVRHFTEEGVYILSMLANTPRAAEFRARLARLLRELRERRIDLARQEGYAQGVSEARRAIAEAHTAMTQARESGRKEGAEAMLALYPKRRETLKKALHYAKMGLSCREIAKLLDGNQRQIGHLLSLARKNGLLAAAKQEQGSLLAPAALGAGVAI